MKQFLAAALLVSCLAGCAVYQAAPYPYPYSYSYYYPYGYGAPCCYGPVYAYPYPAVPPVYGSFGIFLGGGGHHHGWHH